MLDVLTARPNTADLRSVDHYLYGHVDPSTRYSTGAWLADARTLIARPELSKRSMIFVGGTGLYFRALLGGLSDMPEVPDAVRERWRYRLAEEGASRLHRVLRSVDPQASMTIKPADGQRIVRALEVSEVSGRSILDWQSVRGEPLIEPQSAERIIIDVDRAVLAGRIERRLRTMIENGAVEEVRRLCAMDLDPMLPAMKAIGVREFTAVLEGRVSMEDAMTQIATATRRYAKRQATWFRNQCGPEWKRLSDFEQR